MKLDAELFYQENWADSTYTLSNWGDSTVWEWGTRAVANVATLSRDWSNLTDGLAEDTPDGDACADNVTHDDDGVCVNGDAPADIDASSDTFSIHSLGRVSTEDVADNSNFILVDSSTEDLSAENGGSLVDSSMEDLSAEYGGSVISSH
ncbi:hypothetical protein CSAL01_02311 [Colletotrichum salicis]|uniref:Uncharacterized protein n=1 Tax=Colletotrichum salicis TaxID=1209931 RepID=A0A135V2T1_9PEZI|nr:hypothetical protein CSAL01_02311 [Colletotrichum salicis]